ARPHGTDHARDSSDDRPRAHRRRGEEGRYLRERPQGEAQTRRLRRADALLPAVPERERVRVRGLKARGDAMTESSFLPAATCTAIQSINPDSWCDLWHTHVDWRIVGDVGTESNEYRVPLLFLAWARIEERARLLRHPW